MKTIARLFRRAADRLDPQPEIPSRFAPTWYWHNPIAPTVTVPPQGRCERCGQYFYGSHACWTVDPAPWWRGTTYTGPVSTATNS